MKARRRRDSWRIPSRWTILLKRRSKPSPSSLSLRVTCSKRNPLQSRRASRASHNGSTGRSGDTIIEMTKQLQLAKDEMRVLYTTNRQGSESFGQNSLCCRLAVGKSRCPCVSSGMDTASTLKRRGWPGKTPDRRCGSGVPAPLPNPFRRFPANTILAAPEGWNGPN